MQFSIDFVPVGSPGNAADTTSESGLRPSGGLSVLATLDQFSVFGFRVALVPEPATLVLLAAGGLALLRPRRCRTS